MGGSVGPGTGGPARRVRAVVLHGPGDVRLEERALPAPGPGEVLLEVEVALTGGTVLKTVRRGGHARLGRPPLRLGHEGLGRIAVLGSGVSGWRVGERVLPAASGPCGACARCRDGREPLCTSATWFSGLFADAVVLPAAVVARGLHRVPAGLPAERAALADNVASVLKGLEVTPGRPGERALVIGTGPLALLWTRLLAEAGARVLIAGRRLEAARVGLAFGAAEALALDELPRAPAFDLVVEAVGVPETWTQALASAAPGARVNFFGGAPEGTVLPVDARRLHYEELTLTASFHYAPRHVAAALAWLERGLLTPDADLGGHLLGEAVALRDLPAWLVRHAAGSAPLKAVVER